MDRLAVSIGDVFNSPIGVSVGVGGLISIILSNAIILAGLIMVVLFIVGGISIIASAGNDNPEGAAKGKQAVTAAIIGFIIIFAAYWVIQVVELATGLNILQPVFN